MPLLVALRPGARNTAALHLAAELAQALGEPVIAASVVVVAPGVPSPLREGMADRDFVALIAADAMAEARAILGELLLDQFPVRARSVRAGLLELLDEEGATHLVLGSAAGGKPGCVNVGDTAQAMLHTASVPVHLAPPGYAPAPDAHPIRRITVAFGPDDGSRQALGFGAELAHRVDGGLRTVSFFVRQSGGPYRSGGGPTYAAELAAAWREQMEGTVEQAVRGLDELQLPTRWIERVFGDGADWDQALGSVEWAVGDLLVVGSRPRGGLGGVFLGSRAAEILRHATVPVVVLPG